MLKCILIYFKCIWIYIQIYFDIFHGEASVIVMCVKFDDFLE